MAIFSSLGNIVLFLVILSFIILIHELGHFIFARRAGIGIYEFAIGMGPLIKQIERNDIKYSIRAIPMGGYVAMAGEGLELDKEMPKEKLFQSKSKWNRFLVTFMGAGNNFILAFVLLMFTGLVFGNFTEEALIGRVTTGTPADAAGFKAGDYVLEVNGESIDLWEEISLAINESNGEAINFLVEHKDGTVENIIVTPNHEEIEMGDEIYSRYYIGIQVGRKKGIVEGVKYGFTQFLGLLLAMVEMFKQLFGGNVQVNDLSGVVGIYSYTKDQATQGLPTLLWWVSFLSFNVGFLNLLPLPALDGGRIIFILIEAIVGRPIPAKYENKIHTVGLILLLGLTVYVTANDITKLF